MTHVLIKRVNWVTETELNIGRTPCEDEVRDWDAVSTSQGTQKIASKSPEARGEAWKRFFLTVLRKNKPF